jgi:hypothetical protein
MKKFVVSNQKISDMFITTFILFNLIIIYIDYKHNWLQVIFYWFLFFISYISLTFIIYKIYSFIKWYKIFNVIIKDMEESGCIMTVDHKKPDEFNIWEWNKNKSYCKENKNNKKIKTFCYRYENGKKVIVEFRSNKIGIRKLDKNGKITSSNIIVFDK